MNPNQPGNESGLQKFDSTQEIKRERLQELQSYKIGEWQEKDFPDTLLKRDWNFLFQFLPQNVQDKLTKDRNQVGFDNLVGYAISRVEELVGKSMFGRTIETAKASSGEIVPDFSDENLYKMLLEKLKEFAVIHGFRD